MRAINPTLVLAGVLLCSVSALAAPRVLMKGSAAEGIFGQLQRRVLVDGKRIPAGAEIGWSDQRGHLYYESYPSGGYVAAPRFLKAIQRGQVALQPVRGDGEDLGLLVKPLRVQINGRTTVIPAGALVSRAGKYEVSWETSVHGGQVPAASFLNALAEHRKPAAGSVLRPLEGYTSKYGKLTQSIVVNGVTIPAGTIVSRTDRKGQLYFDSYPTTGYVRAKDFFKAVRSAAEKLEGR